MNTLKLSLGLSTAVVALIATPAFAQDAAPQSPAACADENSNGVCDTEEAGADKAGITVTGSRIRRPNLESTVPISSIGGEQIFQGGDPNVGEILNDLPQLRSTFAQSNPGLGIGIAGLNLLDLRGLGTVRTLVLVNGRRHVAADILNNAVSPDVATIPANLIDRIDIVTGGNSAIYGSDALAGVVNFVLRHDYQGIELRGQAETTQVGYGGNQFVSILAGHSFSEGRGNVMASVEYSHQERIFASDIPAFRTQDGLFVTDSDSGGLTNNSDGFPDRTFLRDVRSATIYYGGLIPINQRNIPNTGLCGNATAANNGGTNTAGPAFNCNYIFTTDGRLTPQTGTRFGTSLNGSFIGGNGQTGREGNTLSVLPYLQRLNANLLGHYKFSDAADFFFEAKFARVDALGNNAGPSFIQSGSGESGNIGDSRERPRLDNPFLNPADRTLLGNLILASSCNPSLTVTCPATTNIGTTAAPVLIPGNLTAADQAAIAAGTYRFILGRNLLDVGIRDEAFRRDTYRGVVGVRGTFNTDWSYELSANYGRFNQTTNTDGFIDRQRFSLAMDAARNPATGQIQCRAQFDPAAAIRIQRPNSGDNTVNQNRLAADIAACVPYNPFGQADNRASVAYFSRAFVAKASLDQLVLSGFVSGDSSGFFNMPGGPVSFAVGAEYRREKAVYKQDQFVVDGYTNGVQIPLFDPKPFEVKEAFGELRIPLLKDLPFFEELTLSGAARVASYQGGVGTVWTYNAGVDWAPIKDVRFRGNYSRAVRAPNVSETASPLVANFAPGFVDPCNPAVRNTTTNRAANCLTAIGAATLATFTDIAPSLAVISGSNPALNAERSNSLTLGAVIQPRFIPNFSLSVDYYDITVSNIIVSLTAQQIANACYDQATLNNVFCSQFARNLTGVTNATGDAPGRIVSNSLIQSPLNFAKRVRRGIDFNLNYRTSISSDVKFDTSVIYTHNLKISNFQDQTNPKFENRILGELGDPEDEFRADVDLTVGALTLGYRLRYIGPMYFNTYENYNAINTGQLGATPPGGDDADYFSVKKYPPVTYSDFRLEWNLKGARNFFGGDRGNDLKFYVGVDNAFDRKPPFGATATGAGSAIYDYRGRSFYGGFRAQF